MGIINVTDQSGHTHALEAIEGWPVMQIIRDHGLDIEAICGGACECATCHVVVDEEWADKLYPKRFDEEDKLDMVPNLYDSSRLSCQIIWSRELDGLSLTLAD